MIDRLIEYSQWMFISLMLYAWGVHYDAASEDINLNIDQVYDTLIGKISPQVLWSAGIG